MARAESLAYRFEAEVKFVQGTPPADSLTARAAGLDTITGTFGFDTDAPRTVETGIPGRVGFAAYATGFVALNELDLSALPGPVFLSVGDGIPQQDAPQTTIKDNLIIAFDSQARDDTPVDSLSLEIRFDDAEALAGVAVPSALKVGQIGSARLTVSTRRDSFGDRGNSAAGAVQVLGLAVFDITTIEAID
ncbi:hypothetical protein EJA01_01970 [Rhodovulum iodosum]|uniref:hypothetical protein n=1 Tax=Rhodovulum iodosum TaxID=68291 RepID=UPI000F680654|nr:hypothetical protein [Rhodovulum robiginosum]RSK38513.1 hypothetical protein EJA01_01970 [Rhodovulum robiginosum]